MFNSFSFQNLNLMTSKNFNRSIYFQSIFPLNPKDIIDKQWIQFMSIYFQLIFLFSQKAIQEHVRF